MITTLEWVAQRFDHMDIDDLNMLEREIVDRLIEEGYLVVEPVRDSLVGILDVDSEGILFNEIVYKHNNSVPLTD